MKDFVSLLGRVLRAGMLAAAAAAFTASLTGCILENPGPDPDLYRRFNFYQFQLYGKQGPPMMLLDLERRNGVINVYARASEGAQGDSAEFYLTGDNSTDPYTLPVYFPAQFETYARVKTPTGNDSNLISKSEDHLPSDLRRVNWFLYVLREWKGDSLTGARLGGLYAGEWSMRDNQHKVQSGKLRGRIDEFGSYRLTFADYPSQKGFYSISSMVGVAAGDSLLHPYTLNERPIDNFYAGDNPFSSAKVVTNGDSLQAVIPIDTLYGDSLTIRCARIKSL
jgi:hypothetical protein